MLNTIKEFRKPKWVTLEKKSSPLNGVKAFIKPFKKEFQLSFQSKEIIKGGGISESEEAFSKLQMKSKHQTYILEHSYMGRWAHPKYTAYVDSIHTKGFLEKTKYYYRLVIPLEKELQFHYILEKARLTSTFGYSIRCSSKVSIEDEEIEFCCIHDEKNEHFLVIESFSKQPFDEFSNKANSIQVGLGYITGHYAGNQGYYFAYTKRNKTVIKHHKVVEFRNAMHSGYCPVYSNPHGWIRDRDKALEFQDILRPLKITEFSTLCQRLHGSLDFSSTLVLILESSIASLLFMPGGFAICLETMSDIILGKTKLKLAPIKDKITSAKIRGSFKKIVDENSGLIEPDDLKALYNRIENFNQITNKARLSAPFKKLSILLNEEDSKVLESRNDFLHGRVPDFTKEGKIRSTDRINRDLYYASMRFYTLLSILILKWIGYDNYVVNHVKLQESFTKIKLDEKGYRKV